MSSSHHPRLAAHQHKTRASGGREDALDPETAPRAPRERNEPRIERLRAGREPPLGAELARRGEHVRVEVHEEVAHAHRRLASSARAVAQSATRSPRRGQSARRASRRRAARRAAWACTRRG